MSSRNNHPEVFLEKFVLKICSKFTGEHPCQSAISMRLRSNWIEITLRNVCSPVYLLHIFRTPFLKNTCDGCFWNSDKENLIICAGALRGTMLHTTRKLLPVVFSQITRLLTRRMLTFSRCI